MDGGDAAGVSHVPLFHFGVDDPVVRTLHALDDPAAEEGQGLAEHRTTLGHPVQGGHPLETIGPGRETAQEMAQALLWLASPENSFMNGQAVVLDGGISAL